MAPVNRIPSEILALIPDFWPKHYDGRDRDLVALTHVCRAWREVFISRSSLWTDLGCADEGKTRIYLERSGSLPVNLSLDADDQLSSHHPFSRIIPHAIGRLGSLTIQGTPRNLQDITAHLSRPAPLLKKLWICGGYYNTHVNPVLTPALFNGDLSSLRTLRLAFVNTRLPWRSMVNLTSFSLLHPSPGAISVKKFLDFFEGAPRLRKVSLGSPSPAPGAQDERLVSLACLERIEITGDGSASLLLNHLLIPVGAHLKIEVDLPSPPNKDHPPRFLDNLRNLPNFTAVELHGGGLDPHVQFSGPNGQVTMIPRTSRDDKTRLVLESLDQFDTSKVEQLKIDRGNGGESPSSDPLYRALLPMKHLRTLTLHHCAIPRIFVRALHPTMSSSGTVVCPDLEELVIVFNGGSLDMRAVIEVAAARASRGAKLKSVKIQVIGQDKFARVDLLELKKHVFDVECSPEVDGTDGDGDGITEEG
jgi:hypothetical protein